MAHIGDDRCRTARFIGGSGRRGRAENPSSAAIRATAFGNIGRLFTKRVAIDQGRPINTENGEVFTAGTQLESNVICALLSIVIGIEQQIAPRANSKRLGDGMLRGIGQIVG